MRSNSSRFITAFNIIEEYLSEFSDTDKYFNFDKLVSNAIKAGNEVVIHYQHDLRQFAKLRNAIVHSQKDDTVIAEPIDWTVEQIEKLKDLVINPPKAKPLLKNKVVWVDANRSIAEALELIIPRNLSQAPIYEVDKFVGLLTTDTIARWLAKNITDNTVSEQCSVTVAHVYDKFTENKDNHCFLGLEATTIEALNEFERYEKQGIRLDAILLTPSGELSANIQAIMNTWDVPKALKSIELSSKSQ